MKGAAQSARELAVQDQHGDRHRPDGKIVRVTADELRKAGVR